MQVGELTRPEWPRPAASAAIFRDGRILLVERGKGARGVWSLPGGHIEPGERARDAAQREVSEETGVDVDIRGLVDVHDVLIRPRPEGPLAAHYVLCVYWGLWVSGEAAPASDAASATFVYREDVATFNLTPGLLPLIDKAFALYDGWRNGDAG